MTAQTQFDQARCLATYDQNSQTFRSLNQLMWQIPLIAMTLTGGLWFGVSKAESSPIFQVCLLALAAVGNLVLIVVLARLRYIMGEYLRWLETFDPDGFVPAAGKSLWTRPLAVRTLFQIMLGLAVLISSVLMTTTAKQAGWIMGPRASSSQSIAFYDAAAEDLADSYEAIPFEQAHPFLLTALRSQPPKNILDVGAGTGRDAAFMASLGHKVTAIEPSDKMRQLARATHADVAVTWTDDTLPALVTQQPRLGAFNYIVLSAVWMHVHPTDRSKAMERIADLLAPGGVLYVTLRSGPSDPKRAMYEVSLDELKRLGAQSGLTLRDMGARPDILGRPDVSWRTAILSKPLSGSDAQVQSTP